MNRLFLSFVPFLVLSPVACKSSQPKERESAALSASIPTASASASSPKIQSASAPEVYRVRVGPPLAILPGQGIGPVRFGATLQTIQRLMEAQCTEVTETDGKVLCRYMPHAVDFYLEDGVLVKIHIHGNEREFIPGKGLGLENAYGIFHGGFPNGFSFGMYPKFANLGEPLRKETTEPGRFPTVEKDYYPDMVVEYDKLQNGNVVLGGVVLTKPEGKTLHAPKAAGTPSAAAQGTSASKPGSP